jgi:selenocysteine-specific elongation factor
MEEVREELSNTPYTDAPVVPVSSVTGAGLEEMLSVLTALGSQAEEKDDEDLPRLPVDRVFSIKGAGTIVTGTLWTGRLRTGDRVRILPGGLEARVRSLQLHGKEVDEASAGGRVAVGVAGGGVSHQDLSRGQTLVTGEGWTPSRMLTCHVRVLRDTGWEIEEGQRIRVHLGTAEVLARAVLLEGDRLGPGDEGWAQLRLEAPLLARARDHLVIRSYSPVTTIAGGRVAEVLPEKRRHLGSGEDAQLEALTGNDPGKGLEALLLSAGWRGVAFPALPQLLGYSPVRIRAAVDRLRNNEGGVRVEDQIFSASVWEEGRDRMLGTLSSFHRERPLKPGMPLEELRQALPRRSGPGLGESILRALTREGEIRIVQGLALRSGFSPELSNRQEASRDYLRSTLEAAGLSVPSLRELAEGAGASVDEIAEILRLMEAQGEVLGLEGVLFFHRDAIRRAGVAVVEGLGGSANLGPADFREVLGITRKYLLPVLRYLDTVGITTRVGEDRAVADALPDGWGT